MTKEQIISRSKEILGGTPVFAGTRVPVKTLVDYLLDGSSLDEFLEDFPTVTREQAEGFLHVAAEELLTRA
jgi:uncharacterized protein (DUF433 family)